jgi:ribosomal protein S18 acetylase RimI-like enzyme
MIMTIRTATKSDYIQLYNLFSEENQFHANLEPEYIQVTDDILKKNELDEFISNTNSNIFVCEKNNELLGAIIISIEEEQEDRWKKSRVIGYIDELIVKKSAQRNRIGSQLINAAQTWFLEKNIHTIELHVWESNTNAYQFYNAQGFQSIQRRMKLTI